MSETRVGLGLVSGSEFLICCDLWVTVNSLTPSWVWSEVAATEEWLCRGLGTGTERDDREMQSCQRCGIEGFLYTRRQAQVLLDC